MSFILIFLATFRTKNRLAQRDHRPQKQIPNGSTRKNGGRKKTSKLTGWFKLLRDRCFSHKSYDLLP